jgi:hypothetical protein
MSYLNGVPVEGKDYLENRNPISSLFFHIPPIYTQKDMVTMYNHSPMNQHSMPQGQGYDAGAYQQPTPYGGIGFGLGGGGHDMGGGGQGMGMGQMSMMGGQMGGMGMGGNMMGGGAMGPGVGLGGLGSMSRGMAFGNPQQTSHLMAGMQAGGMGAMGGMGGMGNMGKGAMGQSGFVENFQ